jgi:hypothetical protein
MFRSETLATAILILASVMSVDAFVYCDCLEMARIALPGNVVIRVESDGYPTVLLDGGEIWEDHPDWHLFECPHTRHLLCHHRLGNIVLVGLLRAESTPFKSEYSLLCEKVIYNGSHAGDWLGRSTYPQLAVELEKLRTFNCAGNLPSGFVERFIWKKFRIGQYDYTSPLEAASFMQTFRHQMEELLEAATKVCKPIVF